MDGSNAPAWFVGDLGDPWVLGIAEALPKDALWISRPDDLPESWADEAVVPPPLLVLHRTNLNATDAQRLGRLLSRAASPSRVVLCVSPHARHDDLMRWSRLVDVFVPEAVAAETIARHLHPGPRPRPGPHTPTVTVLSTDFEWREMTADLCRAIGYDALPVRDEPDVNPEGIVVWDVPVLDPAWTVALSRRAERAKVVGLLGFVDRGLVEAARSAGCSVCLESPCELDDLTWALDRIVAARPGIRVNPAHSVPPAPVAYRPGPLRTKSLES